MYAALSSLEKVQFEDMFDKLSVEVQHGNSQLRVLSAAHIPHMCRIMNIGLTTEENSAAVQKFGKKNEATESGTNRQPSYVIDYAGIVALYNHYAPRQSALVANYAALFSLLDPEDRGYISTADLRHALCNAGDSLTDNEFNHMLYSANLLHKATISIYEFVRLGMGIDLDAWRKAVEEVKPKSPE